MTMTIISWQFGNMFSKEYALIRNIIERKNIVISTEQYLIYAQRETCLRKTIRQNQLRSLKRLTTPSISMEIIINIKCQ